MKGIALKVSLNWLSEYIDLKKYKIEDVVQSLTDSGLEVEHVDHKAKHYEHVVVGHIDQVEKHPSADRLTLCQVSTKANESHQIVCGATNHCQGDKVVLALPGAILPNGLKIKSLEIKGQKSSGMLCSKVELGLESQSDGIMILPKEAPLGCGFAKYMGLDDVLLDVNVTSNRADCLSHLGLSRELAAILNLTYKSPPISLKTKSAESSLISVLISQRVSQARLCPRYVGRVINHVQVRPSPTWLVQRLKSVGHSSVNNIVDVTNFVMLELGQPLHAFDVRSIQGQQIQVDLAKNQESFTTLDGTKLTLSGTELMIRDAQKPLALAGIIGGKNSGVYQDTVDVFIESAYFKPEQIRRTSRQFGIETESSYRFSRGVDPDTTLLAMHRACQLIKEVAGGDVQDVFDIYPKLMTRPCIFLNTEDVSSYLGYSVEPRCCYSLLKNLGCQVHFVKEDRASDPMHVGLLKSLGCQSQIEEIETNLLQVTPPSYRQDLAIKEDLIEEIARLEGYHKIPNGKVLTNSHVQPHARIYLLQRHLHDLIRRQGYQQVISLAFCHLKAQKQLLGSLQPLKRCGLNISDNPVSLSNPLSQELNVMRQSLLPALLNILAHNCRHKIVYGRIYEIGYTFQQGCLNKEEKTEINFEEKWHLGIMSWGHPTSAWQKTHPSLILEVKRHISNILKSLGIVSYQWKTADPAPEFLHPGQSAFLFCEGKNVGHIGTLHPQVLKQYKVSLAAVFAEINLDCLLASHPRSLKAKEFSRFPFVERDISILVDKNIEVGAIIRMISQLGGKNLQSVTLFDIYQDPQIPQQKSLAFRLLYQKKEATLAEDEIHQIQVKIIKSLEQKFNAQLRKALSG